MPDGSRLNAISPLADEPRDAGRHADAGIGLPSHAAQAMEMGYDGILLNTAVAKAGDPAGMAEAFALAISAGRLAFAAQPIEARDMAAPSTPVMGKAFLA